MKQIIKDSHLGDIIVTINPRSRRLTFRGKPGNIHVSIPPGTTKAEIQGAIEKLRPKLVAMKQRSTKKLIDLDYRIDAEYFKLSLVSGKRDKFLAHSELGETQIVCPEGIDFNDDKLQEWLQKVLSEALRRNAKIILPQRLYMLSQTHNLPYKAVKINNSEGRWGSCSASKSINLSYYLILLPKHLIDYVLLHELTHTKEMNHGDGFWKILNQLTDNKALALRNEIRNYKTGL